MQFTVASVLAFVAVAVSAQYIESSSATTPAATPAATTPVATPSATPAATPASVAYADADVYVAPSAAVQYVAPQTALYSGASTLVASGVVAAVVLTF
ncbi:UNVERIFIED_CONTAM: hypothetical protein HDU68_008486 [Siphonaria sp. JEL0065]|nr:hypothetical protein HDU68_008486 [Siphonaria sp. JEL0065]